MALPALSYLVSTGVKGLKYKIQLIIIFLKVSYFTSFYYCRFSNYADGNNESFLCRRIHFSCSGKVFLCKGNFRRGQIPLRQYLFLNKKKGFLCVENDF